MRKWARETARRTIRDIDAEPRRSFGVNLPVLWAAQLGIGVASVYRILAERKAREEGGATVAKIAKRSVVKEVAA